MFTRLSCKITDKLEHNGTIYLRARYYNPSIGRFISRDSFAGKKSDPLSLNLYTYCANNPILYVDPSGHSYGVLPDGSKMSINSAWDAKIFEQKKKMMMTDAPGCCTKHHFDGCGDEDESIITSKPIDISSEPLTNRDITWLIPAEVVKKNEELIQDLDSELQPLARDFLVQSNQAGYALFVTWGVRTNTDEQTFIDKGDWGVINGPHVRKIAFDVAFWNSAYKDDWPCNPMDFHYRIMSYNVYPDYSESCWEEIGVIGKNVGLQWGGYWNKQDWPHFQLKN